MHKRYSIPLTASLGALATLPAQAGEMDLKLTLPEISEGMYLRPYVAVWVEKADDTFVETLSLWHMLKDKRGNELTKGDRYLNSLRSWWKSSGTTSQMPIDGISSATRAPGEHQLVFTEGKAPFTNLAPGKYQLVLEVSREVKGTPPGGANGQPPAGMEPGEGGEPPARPEGEEGMAGGPPAGGEGMGASKDASEELRIDFEWPVKKATTLTKSGKAELGKVTLTLKP